MTLQWIAIDDEPIMREMTREQVDWLEWQAKRDAWDLKHPRCEVCGQFIGKVSHFWRDYFGEWDHV